MRALHIIKTNRQREFKSSAGMKLTLMSHLGNNITIDRVALMPLGVAFDISSLRLKLSCRPHPHRQSLFFWIIVTRSPILYEELVKHEPRFGITKLPFPDYGSLLKLRV